MYKHIKSGAELSDEKYGKLPPELKAKYGKVAKGKQVPPEAKPDKPEEKSEKGDK